jgi:hypothetical protein
VGATSLAALAFILLLGLVAANPTEAHESHRPAVPALAGEGTASARGNPFARLDGPFDRSQGSLEVRRAGHAHSESYGYDERVRPVPARWVDEPAIPISTGGPLESGVPRSAKWTSPKYDATHLLRVWHQVVATNTAGAAAEGAAGTTRVSRWMSQAEYDGMVASKEVQVGTGGLKTDVLNPANPAGYAKQAPPGSVYVEFDVPSNALVPGGNTGWNQIPTGSTAVGKNAIKNGGVVSPGVPRFEYFQGR